MTISANSAKSGPVAGDNSNATFTYAFPVLDDGDLVVILTNDKGEETRLSHPADFTATGIGDAAGGTVTLTTTPAIGESVTILRDMTAEQATDFVFQAGYLPREQEDALDRLTMVQQSQAEQLSRAVKVPASSYAAPDAFLQNHNNALLSDYAVKTINPALVIDPVRNIFIGDGTPTTLDTLLTHSRADTATFTDRNGILQTAAANELRNDHHLFRDGMFQRAGLRVDPASENLFRRSEDLADVNPWFHMDSTPQSSSETAPNGSLDAIELIPDATNARHAVYQSMPGSATGAPSTFSVYAKSGDEHRVIVAAHDNSGGYKHRALFDLNAGTILHDQSGGANIESVGNGWHRCSIYDPRSTQKSGIFGPWNADTLPSNSANNPNYPSYQGDGVSGVHLWGAQAEVGEIPTAYIKTDTTSVTRAADTISISATNLPADYSGFTIIAEGIVNWLDADDSAPTNLFRWFGGDVIELNLLQAGGYVSGVSGSSFRTSTGVKKTSNTPFPYDEFGEGIDRKLIAAIRLTDEHVQAFGNGNAYAATTHTGLPAPTAAAEFLKNFTGSLTKFRVFDVALSEAALIEATTL